MLISNARVEGMRTIPYKKKEGKLLKVVIRFGDGETAEATMFDDLARSCTLQPGDIIDFDGHWENKKRLDKSFNNFEIKQYWHSTDTATPAPHSGHAIETDPALMYQFTDDDIKAMTSTEENDTPLNAIKNPLKKEGECTPLNAIKEPLKEGIGSLEYNNETDDYLTSNSDSGQTSHSGAVSEALVEGYKNKNLIGFF